MNTLEIVMWSLWVMLLCIFCFTAGFLIRYNQGLMDGQKLQYQYYQKNGECLSSDTISPFLKESK